MYDNPVIIVSCGVLHWTPLCPYGVVHFNNNTDIYILYVAGMSNKSYNAVSYTCFPAYL